MADMNERKITENKKTAKEHPHDGHRERLRTKYLEKGLDSLEDHEVLELILHFSIPQKNTNDLAHRLIETYCDFHGVFDADISGLKEVENCGKMSALLIRLFADVHKKLLNPPKNARIYFKFDKYFDSGEYLKKVFLGHDNEVLYAFFLDKTNRLLGKEMIGEGTADNVEVNTTKILKAARKYKTYSVVIAHNHPGGNAYPSEADVSVTSYIGTALKLNELRLRDHYIITVSEYFSFLESGFFVSAAEVNDNKNGKKSERRFLFG